MGCGWWPHALAGLWYLSESGRSIRRGGAAAGGWGLGDAGWCVGCPVLGI